MDLQLGRQVVIVTGAARGIAAAEKCARLMAFLLSDAVAPMRGAMIDFKQRVTGAP